MPSADLVRADHGHTGRANSPQRRGAAAVAEHGTLAEDRARADLGHDLAVDLDVEDAVQQYEQLAAGIALLDQRLAAQAAAAKAGVPSSPHGVPSPSSKSRPPKTSTRRRSAE